MNTSDQPAPSNDRDSRLPTKAALRAFAFGLAPRIPEWIIASEQRPAASPESVRSSPWDDWVIVASQHEGWQLRPFQALLRRNGIESALDRSLGVVRVHRSKFRQATSLLRTHRNRLRWKGQGSKRATHDGDFLAFLWFPTLVVLIVFAAYYSHRTVPQSTTHLIVIATMGIIFSLVLTWRISFGRLPCFRRRKKPNGVAPPGLVRADYPPAP